MGQGVCQRQQQNAAEIAANGVLVLLSVVCALLDRQLKSQANAFLNEGGFTERLYHSRKQHRQLN